MRPLKGVAALAGLFIAATAAATIFPHLLYGKRIAGQVVDAVTGEPIAGAHVAFLWESGIIPSGFTGHNSRDICYHAAAVVTDPQGRFEIPPWKEWSTYDVEVHEPATLIYAPRYAPGQFSLRKGRLEPPKERLNERYELRAFTGTVDERLKVMWGGVANRGCSYGGPSQRSLFPMLKAMYEEARQIATTDQQRKQVNGYAVMAANAAIAADPNGASNDADVERFIREKLQ
jgi:hypothetical protein